MSRRRRKKDSTRRRGLTFKILVFVPFCFALIIQGAISVEVLQRSETLDQMETDAYGLFSARVSNRASYLENDMIFRWSNLEAISESVASRIDETLAVQGAITADVSTGSDVAQAIIDAASDDLLLFTRRAEVDGVYLVLTDGSEDGQAAAHAALYVRDSNPKIDIANGSDLQLAACPISVVRRHNIALDSQWSTTFPLAEEGRNESAFFYRPLRAAQQYPDADVSDLGYWGLPTNLGWAGVSSLTYSQPIKSATGDIVGIVGIEVGSDRVAALFPHLDLGEADSGSYVLATTDESDGYTRDDGVVPKSNQPRTYQSQISTGATQSLYVVDSAFTALQDSKGRMIVDASADSSPSGRAIAFASELNLYDSTSPFASEHWTLIGLDREKELFSASRELSVNLTKAFVISLVVGVIIALLTAWVSSSRLRHLMREVRAARPEETIAFTPTGIVEVDELSDAIESLGSEVASAASRLSQTLKLSDRSIASFECNVSTGTVSCMDGFFDTLRTVCSIDEAILGCDIDNPEMKADVSMSVSVFKQLFISSGCHTEQESESRWLISDSTEQRWIRLVTVPSADGLRMFGLIEDVTDEIATRRRIEHERDHDVLTGLLNRRAFEQSVTERLATGTSALGGMLMMDLDNLKYINDTYGHDWGDHYIKAAARVVTHTFEGKGLCSRISGDEFLVYVDQCAHADEMSKLFDDFMYALDTSVLEAPDKAVLKVRASAGVALYPRDASEFESLREYADFAMYEAKNSRKGTLAYFDRLSHEQSSFILNKKEDLNQLLDENLIEYWFQPIVDARVGEVMAYEALMRPQLASIPTPDHVITLARSQSKLYRVEHLTFFEALGAFSQYDCSDDIVLFVNSIATQRLSSDDETELQTRFAPLLKRLVVEITESDYSREMALYKEALVRRWGARLAIDDFGSGYNGETSLLDYRADFVKLDMGIVRDIDQVKDRWDIARNLISFAHDRRILVVAEGVETEAELQTLIDLGVDYLQGYLVGRPSPEPKPVTDAVKNLIRNLAGME